MREGESRIKKINPKMRLAKKVRGIKIFYLFLTYINLSIIVSDIFVLLLPLHVNVLLHCTFTAYIINAHRCA